MSDTSSTGAWTAEDEAIEAADGREARRTGGTFAERYLGTQTPEGTELMDLAGATRDALGGVRVADPHALLTLIELYAMACTSTATATDSLTASHHHRSSSAMHDLLTSALGLGGESPLEPGRPLNAGTIVHDGLGVNEHGVPLRNLPGTLRFEPQDLDGPRWEVSGYLGANTDLSGDDVAGAQQWARSALAERARVELDREPADVARWQHHQDGYGEWWEPVFAQRCEACGRPGERL